MTLTYILFPLRPKLNTVRACLHGGGGPQVGEVTRLDVATRLTM